MGESGAHRVPLTVVVIDNGRVFVFVFNLQLLVINPKLIFSPQFLDCLSEKNNPKINKTSDPELPSPGRSPASEH